ncbi:MAG TPA: SLBB domain-containing protein, partial [Longimicrobiales bacterium]
NIQVRRGNQLVTTVDLYEYLLTGASASDVRLENGDRIFVPLIERRVSIDGEVRRTARYEMKAGETLQDLIAFAGGFRPQAVVSRVQIDRVLPPELRRPGVDRVLIDVPVSDLGRAEDMEMMDGDQVTVFAVGDERRNRVAIAGDVQRPGVYEWQPGLTLFGLIARADGLQESAYRQRAQIYRLVEATGQRALVPASLAVDAAGNPIGRDVVLADRDSVVVYSRTDLIVPDSVEITGYVKNPGRYPLAAGMSVQDLVLTAGGFIEGADLASAELARLRDPGSRTDTVATVYRVPLADSAAVAEAARIGADRMLPAWTETAQEVALAPSDRVLIGQAPGWVPPRTVVITGEVARPGPYALTTRLARLSDLVARAGGVTEDAFIDGAQIVRDSITVGTDLEEALEDPDDAANVVLMDGDSVHVPRLDPVVHVTGAVAFESRVVYQRGADLSYYIEQAGGYAHNADRRRASVTYQSGRRATTSRFLFFTNEPEPRPGSMVFVPSLPPDGQVERINWGAVIQRTVSIVGTIATVIYAYDRLSE